MFCKTAVSKNFKTSQKKTCHGDIFNKVAGLSLQFYWKCLYHRCFFIKNFFNKCDQIYIFRPAKLTKKRLYKPISCHWSLSVPLKTSENLGFFMFSESVDRDLWREMDKKAFIVLFYGSLYSLGQLEKFASPNMHSYSGNWNWNDIPNS